MPLKSTILATAAAAALLAGAGTASAQGLGGGSLYLKAFGGWTIPQSNNFNLNQSATGQSIRSGLDYDTGYTLGIAGGYAISPNIAVEVEYAFRDADADFKNIDVSGTTQSNAWMANAIYTFGGMGPNGAFKPYVGAGLGAADLNYDPKGLKSFNSDYSFAYQLITGVAYDVTPSLTLNGEVRYFGINDQTMDNPDLDFKSPYQTFDALVGATYHF